MKNIATAFTIFAALIYSIPVSALAGCGVSHQECEYPCIEYYPNGTDCWKSNKVCHEVCDDFDVQLSHKPPPKSQSTPSQIHTPPKTEKEIDINTDDLTPPTQNCASADGKVYKCN